MATKTEPPASTPPERTPRFGRARHGRRIERIGDPPRRTMRAGHVIVVGLVCLLLGSLLNAAGLRKTALGQPVGWRRDIATFFAEPLYDVSHALMLDRLRLGFQDVLGRDGTDDVDLTLPGPNTTPRVTTTTEPPPKEAFTPQKKLRLWVGGDSLAVTPGESIINIGGATQVIDIAGGVVDGQVATGLARPEVFNWPGHLVQTASEDQPDAWVLTIGSNDDQDLTGEGGGVGSFGSPEWIAEYGRRVGGLLDQLTADGRKVILVGIPIMRNLERSENRYRIINDIYASEAKRREGRVYFVDTYDLLKGPDGGYADYLPNPDGTLVQVRAADGIHLTRAGADRIAQKVIDALNEVYDLTSWQQAPTTTTTSGGPENRRRAPG